MTTGNDLVTGALRVITTVTPGEPVDGTEAANALTVLNRMLKSWSASSLMPPCRTLESFPLVQGRASYTFGQTGSPDFNSQRPDEVTFVFRRDIYNKDRPLTSWTKEQYDSLYDKNMQGLPEAYFYDPQFPNGVLYLNRAPNVPMTLFVESLISFKQFTNL